MTRRKFKDMPARIRRLPVSARGFPIPKFVEYVDGEPDFRLFNATHMKNCIHRDLCWICGEPLGSFKAFPIGPMCCINRITAEPPSHYECAVFAAKNCPFLSNPEAKRRERGMPENKTVAGTMIEDNPGMTAIWVTRNYQIMLVSNGILFVIGEPESLEFWKEGRIATRAEIDAKIIERFPILLESAQEDGRLAVEELNRKRERFEAVLEATVPATVPHASQGAGE